MGPLFFLGREGAKRPLVIRVESRVWPSGVGFGLERIPVSVVLPE